MGKAYDKLIQIINKTSSIPSSDFKEATAQLEKYIFKLNREKLLDVLSQIGTIPESIVADSSEEKIYSKASDIVLAKALRTLGLKSAVNTERSDAADVTAESKMGHRYSLVADSKCFRASRTARNQKDYKIPSLSAWRGASHDYALLVAPHFQYPAKSSQIYADALDKGVCLISWEQLCILISKNVTETKSFSLSIIWSAPEKISRDRTISNKKDTLIPRIDGYCIKAIGIKEKEYYKLLCGKYTKIIDKRCEEGIVYWDTEAARLKGLSRKAAIAELLKTSKISAKQTTIKDYRKRVELFKVKNK